MKNQGKILLGAVLLAAVLAGASAGYGYLSKRYDPAGEEIRVDAETPSADEGESSADEGVPSAEEEMVSVDEGELSADEETPSADEGELSANEGVPSAEEKMVSADEGEDDSAGSSAAGETSGTEAGTQPVMAPDFSMMDENGDTVSLSDYLGKPVVMNFWATWCGPCRAEMPHFDKAYEEYKDKISFLIVDLTDGSRDTVESASAFIEEQGYEFPVYFDTEYNGAYAYGINSIPMTFFINENGEIQDWQIGTLSEEVLFEKMEKLAGTD